MTASQHHLQTRVFSRCCVGKTLIVNIITIIYTHTSIYLSFATFPSFHKQNHPPSPHKKLASAWLMTTNYNDFTTQKMIIRTIETLRHFALLAQQKEPPIPFALLFFTPTIGGGDHPPKTYSIDDLLYALIVPVLRCACETLILPSLSTFLVSYLPLVSLLLPTWQPLLRYARLDLESLVTMISQIFNRRIGGGNKGLLWGYWKMRKEEGIDLGVFFFSSFATIPLQ